MPQSVPPDEGSVFRVDPIELVSQGMKVVDARDQEIGAVAFVKMGDPGSVTTAGTDYQTPGFVRDMARGVVGEEPDVPEALRAQLLRSGFLKVNGKGFNFFTGSYVPADRIARVSGDTVYLTITHDQTIEEAHPGGV